MNQRRCWSTLAIMQPVIHPAPEPVDRKAERAAGAHLHVVPQLLREARKQPL